VNSKDLLQKIADLKQKVLPDGGRAAALIRRVSRLLSGKTLAIIKALVFINVACFVGIYLGIKVFFPNDFILTKINEVLFVKDLALISDDISISPLLSITFSDGELTQKGNKAFTFGELSFSPAIFDVLAKKPAGTVSISDVNNQGGRMDLTFNTEEDPCYSFFSEELPLSLFKPFTGDISLTGGLSGEANLCSVKQKYSGKVGLSGVDVVLRGKIPTAMGDFDVGKIILGDVELEAEADENKVEISKLIISKGLIDFDVAGKVILNTRTPNMSRIDLDVRVVVPNPEKLAENAALNLLVSTQFSQYKTDESSYAFLLKGTANKPQLSRAPKERPARVQPGAKRGEAGEEKAEKPERAKKTPSQARPKPQNRPAPKAALPAKAPAPAQPEPAADTVKAEEKAREAEAERKRREEEAKMAEQRRVEEEKERMEDERKRIEDERERMENERKRMEDEMRQIEAERERAAEERKRAEAEAEEARRIREEERRSNEENSSNGEDESEERTNREGNNNEEEE